MFHTSHVAHTAQGVARWDVWHGILRIRYAVPHNIGRRFDRDVVVEAGHSRRRKKKPSRAYRAEPETIYRNIFLVRLVHDGRCSEFTECFMKEPAAED